MKKNILAENMRRFATKNLNENLKDYGISIDINGLYTDVEKVFDEYNSDERRSGKDHSYLSGIDTETRKSTWVSGIVAREEPSSWMAWLTKQFQTVNVTGPSGVKPQTQTITADSKDVRTLANEYVDQIAGGKFPENTKLRLWNALTSNTTKS
jgi:hypothetical protein